MTLQPDTVRLRHINDAAATIARFIAGRGRGDIEQDEMLRLALIKLVEIIGEAAKQISAATRARYPAVAWTDAARMRDKLVHHYFDVDLDVLWATVKQDIPEILAGLQATSSDRTTTRAGCDAPSVRVACDTSASEGTDGSRGAACFERRRLCQFY